MMSFKEGLGYVSVKLLPANNTEFAEWYHGLKVENKIPFEKLHVTLMYDPSNRIFQDIRSSKMLKAWPDLFPFAAMGEEGSKWAATVIKLKSPEMDVRHKQLVAKGFRHSHSEFIPHMSLTYGGNRQEILEQILDYAHTNPIPSILFFGEESWKPTK